MQLLLLYYNQLTSILLLIMHLFPNQLLYIPIFISKKAKIAKNIFDTKAFITNIFAATQFVDIPCIFYSIYVFKPIIFLTLQFL